jgi:hypothetical protein
MPLVRKPRDGGRAAGDATAAIDIHADLLSGDPEARWAAARAAAGRPEFASALATAVRHEGSRRVREALFTSLARVGPAGVASLQALLRSDDADLRGGALDALRLVARGDAALLPALLADADADIRILSCELARELPAPQATALLGSLLQREGDPNVCAAAIDVLAEAGQAGVLPVLQECAARFAATPFLAFAIQVAIDRISAQTPRPRG